MLRTTMGIAGCLGLATALVGLTSGVASAQEYEGQRPYLTERVAAPYRALEIGASLGYTQGFGQFSAPGAAMLAGRPIPSGGVDTVAGPGLSTGLNLGYRANPYIRIGWTGQIQKFQAAEELGGDASAMGIGTSVDVAFHTNPYHRLDPWVSVGAGHRAIWAAPAGENNNTLIHGLQLAKVQVGMDLRTTRNVAIGPMIGADLDMFFWRAPEAGTAAIIGSKKLSTFVYAGVQATFDVAGERRRRPVTGPVLGAN
jgi:hypothetical protein